MKRLELIEPILPLKPVIGVSVWDRPMYSDLASLVVYTDQHMRASGQLLPDRKMQAQK